MSRTAESDFLAPQHTSHLMSQQLFGLGHHARFNENPEHLVLVNVNAQVSSFARHLPFRNKLPSFINRRIPRLLPSDSERFW